MKIDILTLFPEMFTGPFDASLVGKARQRGDVEIVLHQLRDWATDKHKTVDDRPYGGGAGMVLKVDVIDKALAALSKSKIKKSKVILLTPQGKKLNQKIVEGLAEEQHLILVAGHYEGFDERVRALVDREISIGDYILTGGELPAMVLTDAIVRLQPGVVGDPESLRYESFSHPNSGHEEPSTMSHQPSALLDYPHYTRPESYTPMSRSVGVLAVPEMLKSGDHAKITSWRQSQAERRTKLRRPDLIG